ncbi:alpha/beta fold hydrolase [Streptomyces sp. CA2R101]|uniref:alpha/beta fold hydrolase n=1 Tax=Streptomyces sp. CA2R101 TaxID=3120152 RepID=UPI00300B9CF7
MESKEAGLPLVFVHGTRLSGTMWHPVIRALGERHPTAAPDLPGHGDRRGEPFSIPGAVAAVTEAMDALGGRAVLVGLSLGGYVAIATAAAHPDRVLGTVAMGCTALPRGAFAAAYRGAARLAARHPRQADRLSRFAFRRTLPPPQARAMVSGGLSCEIAPSIIQAVSEMDPPALLSAYPGPVWLVNGERDHFRRHERRFLRACRDGRLIIRPGCGHITSLTDTADLTRHIRDAATVVAARSHNSSIPEGAR